MASARRSTSTSSRQFADLGGSPYPEPLNAAANRWFDLYSKHAGQDLGPRAFDHVKRVVDCAIIYGVIEPKKITDQKADPTGINLQLANVIFPHLFGITVRAAQLTFPSEDFGRYRHVTDGYDVFNGLRDNDLALRDPGVYTGLLSNPSLGLLARMVDVLQYAPPHLHLAEVELGDLPGNLFYVFNKKSIKPEASHIAGAIRKVYFPLAEVLGYPQMAGDLICTSIFHSNLLVYTTVKEALDSFGNEVRDTSLLFSNGVLPALKKELEKRGFEFEVTNRHSKHPGKVMEKVQRYLGENGGMSKNKSEEEVKLSITDQVRSLADLAAARIILISRNGTPITQNDLPTFREVAELIVQLTQNASQIHTSEITDNISKPKANGYQDFKVDLVFTDPRLFRFEVILMTPSMYLYSEHGGAAHYLYKAKLGGGNSATQVTQTVANAYGDVVRSLQNGHHKLTGDIPPPHSSRITVQIQADGKTQNQMLAPNVTVLDAIISAGFDPLTGRYAITNFRGSHHLPIDLGSGILDLGPTPTIVLSSGSGRPIGDPIIRALVPKVVLPATKEALRQRLRDLKV